jgi:hypothetical protein
MMATRRTSKLVATIQAHTANINNPNTSHKKRHGELAALGGVVFANRRKILRALEEYERREAEANTDLQRRPAGETGGEA